MSGTATVAVRPTGGDLVVLAAFTLLSLALLTLFLDWDTSIGAIKVKPFDLVAAICLPPMLLIFVLGPGLRVSLATALFLAFIGWHTFSAFTLGRSNGLRETVQSLELVMLLLVLQQLVGRINWRAIGRIFIVALGIILAYVAWWHVSEGYLAGWKRFEGAKLLFTILPTIIMMFVVFRAPRLSTASYVIFGLVFIVGLFAGERKAMMHIVTMAVILLALGYFDKFVFAAGAIVAIAVGVIASEASPYVAGQLATLSSLSDVSNVSSSELQAGYLPTSMSNAQRVFSASVSQELFQLHPIFGIGTNGFLDYIVAAYPGIAKWLIVGIHNEFQRVLVENGLFGLALYVAVWARALVWLSMSWPYIPRPHRACYLFLISAFFYQAFFEGSGNELFIMLIFIALLPEIFAAALRRSSFEGSAEPVVAWSPAAPADGEAATPDPRPQA
jgi:hypothetical protein